MSIYRYYRKNRHDKQEKIVPFEPNALFSPLNPGGKDRCFTLSLKGSSPLRKRANEKSVTVQSQSPLSP